PWWSVPMPSDGIGGEGDLGGLAVKERPAASSLGKHRETGLTIGDQGNPAAAMTADRTAAERMRELPVAGANTIIDIRNLGLTFQTADTPVYALSDINLQIEAGEFVSFIGPSGCGKTTLMRIIADLEQPTAGTVTVN